MDGIMGVGFNDLQPQSSPPPPPPPLFLMRTWYWNGLRVCSRRTISSQSQRNKSLVASCRVLLRLHRLCFAFFCFCFALLRFYSHHHPALRTSPPASGNLIHQKDGIQRCTCTHPRITDLPTSYLHCCSTAARRRKSMPAQKHERAS
jgi:hypothetical protein